MAKNQSNRKATQGSGFSVNSEGAKRAKSLTIVRQWEDVPAEVIKSLVVAYAGMGDAILFGSSQDREVMALRVYRAGGGYSVYARTLDAFDTALERLDRYCPSLTPLHRVAPPRPSQEQVKTPPSKRVPFDWESLKPVNKQENQISEERMRKLASGLARMRQNKVDNAQKNLYPELAPESREQEP